MVGTERSLLAPQQQLAKIHLRGCSVIKVLNTVYKLGVIFDEHMIMDSQVCATAKFAYCYLRNVQNIISFLITPLAMTCTLLHIQRCLHTCNPASH